MINVKMVIAYFGVPFLGWQKTEMGSSIEELLQTALETIVQHKIVLQAASRTDAGVHAEGQVVNFFLPHRIDLRRLKHSLNGLLPKEIAVLEAEEVQETFHPTLDNVKKEYWYHVCNSFAQLPFYRDTSWHLPSPLDLEAMQQAAKHFLGTHDFSALCNELKLWERETVCHMEKIEITPLPSQRFQIAMVGDRFLYKMARNIAGTLAYAGCGKIEPDSIPKILKSKDRTNAGVTAPAHGLTLKHVFFSELR